MKFILALSVLAVLTSAASVQPRQRRVGDSTSRPAPPVENDDAIQAAFRDLSSSQAGLGDLLNKIKTGVAKGLAGSETGADAFDSIFKQDFAKMFGSDQVPNVEKLAQLKGMLGTDADFKSILDSDIYKKLFPENLVKSFFKDGESLDAEAARTAHTQIDEFLAQTLEVPVEVIRSNREKGIEKLEEMKSNPNFSWDSVLSSEFVDFINSEL